MHYEIELYRHGKLINDYVLVNIYIARTLKKAEHVAQQWERLSTNNEAIIYKVG